MIGSRFVRLAATAATLAALLVGLSRGWEFWSIVQRAILAHVGVLAVGTILLALAKIAIDAEPQRPAASADGAADESNTDGTKSAA